MKTPTEELNEYIRDAERYRFIRDVLAKEINPGGLNLVTLNLRNFMCRAQTFDQLIDYLRREYG